MSLVARIERARNAHGLSQAAVAHRAGISRVYYSQIASGQKKPGLDVVEALLSAVGLDDDEPFVPEIVSVSGTLTVTDSAGNTFDVEVTGTPPPVAPGNVSS